MKITVGVSNRHVHLTYLTYKELFQKDELVKRNDLHQVGEFAAVETINIEYNGKTIENVRIVGPFRKYNQVELLGSDLEFLGIDAPVRRSGLLDNTPSVTLVHDGIKVTTNGVIRSERHVHVPSSKEDYYDLHERDKVEIHANGKVFDANVKVSDNGYYELHIDKDEAEYYGLKNGDEVEIYHVANR